MMKTKGRSGTGEPVGQIAQILKGFFVFPVYGESLVAIFELRESIRQLRPKAAGKTFNAFPDCLRKKSYICTFGILAPKYQKLQ